MSTIPKLITIIGPTASGKSKLALKLAKSFRGAIISADSQQVYRGVPIGTNQPKGLWRMSSGEWRQVPGRGKLFLVQGVPHFLVGTLSLRQQFTAADFQRNGNRLISKISAAGFLPIIVGGTGLYISAITEGYVFPEGHGSTRIRAALEKLSPPPLLAELKRRDPATDAVIQKQNRRRVIRALEYVHTTGKSFTQSQQKSPRPNTLIIGLRVPKAKLRAAIERRTQQMFRRGIITETKCLLRHYPKPTLLTSLGYREAAAYLRGEIDLAEAQTQTATYTWQYARRQMTWFRRMPGVHWVSRNEQAERLARRFLSPAS